MCLVQCYILIRAEFSPDVVLVDLDCSFTGGGKINFQSKYHIYVKLVNAFLIYYLMISKYLWFFCLIFLSNICFAKYAGQIESFYRVGTSQIGRLSVLQPIKQRKNQLIFLNAIVMQDNSPSTEGNLGIGYRLLKGNQIIGSYLYYDIRRTSNKNLVHQFTIGGEYLRQSFEARINGYLPLTNKFVLSSQNKFGELSHDSSNVYIETFTTSVIERAYSGIDFEVGYTSKASQFNLYLGGYYFAAKSRKIIGPQVRLESKPLDWLTLSAEFKHDKIRQTNFHVGFGIRFALVSTNKSPYELASKMTQMPIRDIDAVTSTAVEIKNLKRNELTIVRDVVGFKASMDKGDKYIGVADGIDFLNTTVKVYGTKDNPIKGLYITGIEITEVNGEFTKVSQQPKELRNFVLPANSGETISINGTNQIIPIAILNAIQDSEVGYLKVNNWSSTNAGDRAAGLIGLSKGETNIHHNTNLSNMVENKAGLVGIATDVTIVQFNENRGDMVVGTTNDLYSAGVLLIASGSSVVQENTTYGKTRGLSGGILLEAYDVVIVRVNNNYSTEIRDYSGGIILKSFNRSSIFKNFNKAKVRANCAGIVIESYNFSKIENNRNEGEVRDGSSGIIMKGFDNSEIKFNKNAGPVSGDDAVGIISFAPNSISIVGNINIAPVTGNDSGPLIYEIGVGTYVNNNYWQIHNDPADRNLPVVAYLGGPVTQTNGGALTRQELIDRGLI